MVHGLPTNPPRSRSDRGALAAGADKRREAEAGCDGTWVAHPDLIPVAMSEFDRILGGRPNQIGRQRDDVAVTAEHLLNPEIEGGAITEGGVRTNVSVGIRYMASWLSGTGAAAIDNLMEDAATAEISRSQIWQWVRHGHPTTRQPAELPGRPRTWERSPEEFVPDPEARGEDTYRRAVSRGPAECSPRCLEMNPRLSLDPPAIRVRALYLLGFLTCPDQ